MRALILIEDGKNGTVNITAAWTCRPGREKSSPAGQLAAEEVVFMIRRLEAADLEKPHAY